MLAIDYSAVLRLVSA